MIRQKKKSHFDNRTHCKH